jgi:hypothetical protein
MTTEIEGRRDRSSDDLRAPAARTPRRWFRRGSSRLEKVLERNARWAAEARSTPPLYLHDAA